MISRTALNMREAAAAKAEPVRGSSEGDGNASGGYGAEVEEFAEEWDGGDAQWDHEYDREDGDGFETREWYGHKATWQDEAWRQDAWQDDGAG